MAPERAWLFSIRQFLLAAIILSSTLLLMGSKVVFKILIKPVANPIDCKGRGWDNDRKGGQNR